VREAAPPLSFVRPSRRPRATRSPRFRPRGFLSPTTSCFTRRLASLFHPARRPWGSPDRSDAWTGLAADPGTTRLRSREAAPRAPFDARVPSGLLPKAFSPPATTSRSPPHRLPDTACASSPPLRFVEARSPPAQAPHFYRALRSLDRERVGCSRPHDEGRESGLLEVLRRHVPTRDEEERLPWVAPS
jgi:hypothetical protein